MGFNLLSGVVHTTHLAIYLTSRTCITIVDFSENFEQRQCILLQENIIRIADILDITVLGVVMLVSRKQIIIYN